MIFHQYSEQPSKRKKTAQVSGFLISFPGGSLVQVVLGLELFHTSASVSELLLSCKEWMARWANVRSDFFLYGLCHKCVTACASYFTFLIFRMDSFLHAFYFLSCSAAATQIFCLRSFSMLRYSLYTISHMKAKNKRFLQKTQADEIGNVYMLTGEEQKYIISIW